MLGEVSLGDEEDSENKEDLTDDEADIKAYLAHGDSPSDELFKKYTEIFWLNEPYRLVTLPCQMSNDLIKLKVL